MKLLESISNMQNGIQVDRFLYEMMVIWSAVHELEIEVLVQVYEAIDTAKDGKISWHTFHSVVNNIIGTSEAVSLKEYLKHTSIDDVFASDAFVEATLNCRSQLQHDLHRKICVAISDKERIELELLLSQDFQHSSLATNRVFGGSSF